MMTTHGCAHYNGERLHSTKWDVEEGINIVKYRIPYTKKIIKKYNTRFLIINVLKSNITLATS